MRVKNNFFHFWLYFKKGRNEIGLLYSVVNTLLLVQIRFDYEMSIIIMAAYVIGFIAFSTIGGYFLTKQVDPQQNVINPFAQDGLNSAVWLQRSLVCFYEGDQEGAISNMKKAIELREKWIA